MLLIAIRYKTSVRVHSSQNTITENSIMSSNDNKETGSYMDLLIEMNKHADLLRVEALLIIASGSLLPFQGEPGEEVDAILFTV